VSTNHVPENTIPPKLAEAFLRAIDRFKNWRSDELNEPVVSVRDGLSVKITTLCQTIETVDAQMPEPVLQVVRPFWDEVNFGEPMIDRSYANGARLLRNRTEMRRALYRAQYEAATRMRMEARSTVPPQ
jgi:hypothetical protein